MARRVWTTESPKRGPTSSKGRSAKDDEGGTKTPTIFEMFCPRRSPTSSTTERNDGSSLATTSSTRPGKGDPTSPGRCDFLSAVSYARLSDVERDIRRLANLGKHRPLAFSKHGWEHLKFGGGTPPVRIPRGWLMVYHRVPGTIDRGLDHQPDVRYSAGVMILAHDDPLQILYRSGEPVLEPESEAERVGIVDNVVFPTALDAREDGRIDVYYGMADARIGVARIQVPDDLA